MISSSSWYTLREAADERLEFRGDREAVGE